jgi:hypothetical protein
VWLTTIKDSGPLRGGVDLGLLPYSVERSTRLWRSANVPAANQTNGAALSDQHLDPPDKALVLCVDEKPQIQAYPRDDAGVRDGG